MSSVLRVSLRHRWAAKSMVVRRWLVQDGQFTPGSTICEMETDGEVTTFRESRLGPADIGGVYHYFVAEGQEVPPSGMLLEYSDSGGLSRSFILHESARRPLLRRNEYPRFFLSYRRQDSEPYAWRLYESLASTWGDVDVFMDQYSIQPGEVFPWTIQQAAVHAKTMLVLIGPDWLTMTDDSGKRRLDDSEDYVRREIVAALDRGTLVVPLLLPGAAIPDRSALPEDMETLVEVQFYELSHRHWRSETGKLKDYLDRYYKDVLKEHIS